MVQWRYMSPWQTVGAIDYLKAIERALKIARKAPTEDERYAALRLIKQQIAALEAHLGAFDPATGFPRRPGSRPPVRNPGPPIERSLDELEHIAASFKTFDQRLAERPANEDR